MHNDWANSGSALRSGPVFRSKSWKDKRAGPGSACSDLAAVLHRVIHDRQFVKVNAETVGYIGYGGNSVEQLKGNRFLAFGAAGEALSLEEGYIMRQAMRIMADPVDSRCRDLVCGTKEGRSLGYLLRVN
jgi:hypothetical protein